METTAFLAVVFGSGSGIVAASFKGMTMGNPKWFENKHAHEERASFMPKN